MHKSGVYRIIDANINRAKEGLRVCEEVARFILNSRRLTIDLKSIRHKIDSAVKCLPAKTFLIEERESKTDIGKHIYVNELKRKKFQDIFFANIQRVKESIRVLEEFTKLIDKKIAIEFKKIRYELYDVEKKSAKKISALCNY